MVLKAYFYFVVNEHYDCQVLLSIGNAVVQSSVVLRPYKMRSSNISLLFVTEFVFLTD